MQKRSNTSSTSFFYITPCCFPVKAFLHSENVEKWWWEAKRNMLMIAGFRESLIRSWQNNDWNDWKKARVSPVFKNGSKLDLSNYHPISVIPLIAKILEKLIHDQLWPLSKYKLPIIKLPVRISVVAQYPNCIAWSHYHLMC